MAPLPCQCPLADHPRITRDGQSYSDCQKYSDRGALWATISGQPGILRVTVTISEILWQGGLWLTVLGQPRTVRVTVTDGGALWLTFLGQPGTDRDSLTGWAFHWPSLHNQGWSEFHVVVRDTMTGYPLGDHPRITKDGQSSSDHQRYCNMQGVSDGTSLAWQSLNVHKGQHY